MIRLDNLAAGLVKGVELNAPAPEVATVPDIKEVAAPDDTTIDVADPGQRLFKLVRAFSPDLLISWIRSHGGFEGLKKIYAYLPRSYVDYYKLDTTPADIRNDIIKLEREYHAMRMERFIPLMYADDSSGSQEPDYDDEIEYWEFNPMQEHEESLSMTNSDIDDTSDIPEFIDGDELEPSEQGIVDINTSAGEVSNIKYEDTSVDCEDEATLEELANTDSTDLDIDENDIIEDYQDEEVPVTNSNTSSPNDEVNGIEVIDIDKINYDEPDEPIKNSASPTENAVNTADNLDEDADFDFEDYEDPDDTDFSSEHSVEVQSIAQQSAPQVIKSAVQTVTPSSKAQDTPQEGIADGNEFEDFDEEIEYFDEDEEHPADVTESTTDIANLETNSNSFADTQSVGVQEPELMSTSEGTLADSDFGDFDEEIEYDEDAEVEYSEKTTTADISSANVTEPEEVPAADDFDFDEEIEYSEDEETSKETTEVMDTSEDFDSEEELRSNDTLAASSQSLSTSDYNTGDFQFEEDLSFSNTPTSSKSSYEGISEDTSVSKGYSEDEFTFEEDLRETSSVSAEPAIITNATEQVVHNKTMPIPASKPAVKPRVSTDDIDISAIQTKPRYSKKGEYLSEERATARIKGMEAIADNLPVPTGVSQKSVKTISSGNNTTALVPAGSHPPVSRENITPDAQSSEAGELYEEGWTLMTYLNKNKNNKAAKHIDVVKKYYPMAQILQGETMGKYTISKGYLRK